MKLALWTPAPAAAWARMLAARLGSPLELVTGEPPTTPAVDLDLYHLAGAPEHGFVYRALLRRPGVVLLAEWELHALVHAETAGRGDASAYLREARHAHGDTGVFVARQVLAGLGGSLPRLVAMNQRALEHGLGVVAFTEELRARAAARTAERPVVHLALGRLSGTAEAATGPGPAALAQDVVTRLRALVERLAPHAEAERRKVAERARAWDSPPGRAQDELRWSARELGLAEPPADAAELVASLLEARP